MLPARGTCCSTEGINFLATKLGLVMIQKQKLVRKNSQLPWRKTKA